MAVRWSGRLEILKVPGAARHRFPRRRPNLPTLRDNISVPPTREKLIYVLYCI